MLERAHRGGVPSSSVALLLALSCTSEPAEGEGGLRDLPPIDWKGRFIEFGTDVDTEICPSTLPAMDEYMEGVDEHVRSNASYPVRYYYLQEQLTHYGFGCGDDAWGCARYEHGRSIVGSTQLSLRHELIHASTTASRHRLLEEGLAVLMGTDLLWAGIADPLDIRAAFDSIEGEGRGLPREFYPVAGHFVSHLVEQHGLPATVSLVEASASGMMFTELDALFVEHLGLSLPLSLDAYEAAGPGCEVAQYSPMWFECELTPPSIPIFACEASGDPMPIDIDVTCAGGASGVQDGMVWRDILIDAPMPSLSLINLLEGHPVELVVRGCGQGCSTPFRRIASSSAEPGPIFDAFELQEGLNLVRIIKPVESEGRVRFSIGMSCF